MIWILKIF